MDRARIFLLASCALQVACGKVAGGDAPNEAGADGSMGDANSTGDGFSGIDAGFETFDGSCAPYWCGCGQCDRFDIVCTSHPPSCPPRKCASDCVDLAQTICKTERSEAFSERCVRVDLEAGEPQACLRDGDCPPGQCCPIVNAMIGRCILAGGGPCGGH